MTVTKSSRRRSLACTDLVRVNRGVGVSVELKAGGWIHLPDVGNAQSVTNSIRAWLARTSAHS